MDVFPVSTLGENARPKSLAFMSVSDQDNPHKSVDPPYVITVSVFGQKTPGDLFLSVPLAVPPLTIFTELSLIYPTEEAFNSTSTTMPSIVAPDGIEKPKFVAFKYCDELKLLRSTLAYELFEDAAFDGDVHVVVPYDASFANVPPLFGP